MPTEKFAIPSIVSAIHVVTADQVAEGAAPQEEQPGAAGSRRASRFPQAGPNRRVPRLLRIIA